MVDLIVVMMKRENNLKYHLLNIGAYLLSFRNINLNIISAMDFM